MQVQDVNTRGCDAYPNHTAARRSVPKKVTGSARAKGACADCRRGTPDLARHDVFELWLCGACGSRRFARLTQSLLLDGECSVAGFRAGDPIYIHNDYAEQQDAALTQKARDAALRGNTLRLINEEVVEIPLYGDITPWVLRPWKSLNR